MFHSCRLMRHRGAPLIPELPRSFAPRPPRRRPLRHVRRVTGGTRREAKGKRTGGTRALGRHEYLKGERGSSRRLRLKARAACALAASNGGEAALQGMLTLEALLRIPHGSLGLL